MTPNSGDLAYLKACNEATFTAMIAANPNAIYLMQVGHPPTTYTAASYNCARYAPSTAGLALWRLLLDLQQNAGKSAGSASYFALPLTPTTPTSCARPFSQGSRSGAFSS